MPDGEATIVKRLERIEARQNEEGGKGNGLMRNRAVWVTAIGALATLLGGGGVVSVQVLNEKIVGVRTEIQSLRTEIQIRAKGTIERFENLIISGDAMNKANIAYASHQRNRELDFARERTERIIERVVGLEKEHEGRLLAIEENLRAHPQRWGGPR